MISGFFFEPDAAIFYSWYQRHMRKALPIPEEIPGEYPMECT